MSKILPPYKIIISIEIMTDIMQLVIQYCDRYMMISYSLHVM